MSWYGITALDIAFSRTKKALFEPFDFWKWAKLAIIIFLLGSSGSNFGGQSPNYQENSKDLGDVIPYIEPGWIPELPSNSPDFRLAYSDLIPGIAGTPEILRASTLSELFQISEFIQKLLHLDSQFIPNYFVNEVSNEGFLFTDNPFTDLALLAALIGGLFLIILIFIYISNIMEFVFVESLVRNEVEFWNYSRRFLGNGFYLLLVRLAIGLVFFVLFAIFFLPLILIILEEPSNPGWPAIFGSFFWIMGVIALLVLFALIINSFISLAIPLAIYKDTGILSAVKLVFSNFKKSWQELVVYWLIRFVLGIGIGIASLIIFGVLIVVLGLLFVILDGILYFFFSALLSESLGWLPLIPIIILEFILLFGALLLLSVPLEVFMKYHLLSFLEAWFAGADIPFFDIPNSNPNSETGLSVSETNF